MENYNFQWTLIFRFFFNLEKYADHIDMGVWESRLEKKQKKKNA